MNLCKDCMFWKKLHRFGECDQFEEMAIVDIVTDCEDVHCDYKVFTHSKFGCVMYKPINERTEKDEPELYKSLREKSIFR